MATGAIKSVSNPLHTSTINGYNFYFQVGAKLILFPITPAKLSIKVGSNNKVVTLIDEGDINLLKSPSLIEVEFEARFPMRKYPYSRTPQTLQTYYDTFKSLKEDRQPFRFIVTRSTPRGVLTWDTNLLVALEEFTLSEDADEGDDVIIKFKLKQYKEYGVKYIRIASSSSETTSTSNSSRPTDNQTNTTRSHVVKKGDTLYAIAKKYYGKGSLWQKIYTTNKTKIENDAKKHGRTSSSNGHWIYPGLVLIIPPQ